MVFFIKLSFVDRRAMLGDTFKVSPSIALLSTNDNFIKKSSLWSLETDDSQHLVGIINQSSN